MEGIHNVCMRSFKLREEPLLRHSELICRWLLLRAIHKYDQRRFTRPDEPVRHWVKKWWKLGRPQKLPKWVLEDFNKDQVSRTGIIPQAPAINTRLKNWVIDQYLREKEFNKFF
jgi:hypothetical protein